MVKRKCPLCGKYVTQSRFRTWLYNGKIYRGCIYCYFKMRDEIANKDKPVSDDDIL